MDSRFNRSKTRTTTESARLVETKLNGRLGLARDGLRQLVSQRERCLRSVTSQKEIVLGTKERIEEKVLLCLKLCGGRGGEQQRGESCDGQFHCGALQLIDKYREVPLRARAHR
jgi:hypothetical protein